MTPYDREILLGLMITGALVWLSIGLAALWWLCHHPYALLGLVAVVLIARAPAPVPFLGAALGVLAGLAASVYLTLRFIANRPSYAMTVMVLMALVASGFAAMLVRMSAA